MFANVYLARKSDINFSEEKMAVGGRQHEGQLGRRSKTGQYTVVNFGTF